jgi:hypothetical protein
MHRRFDKNPNQPGINRMHQILTVAKALLSNLYTVRSGYENFDFMFGLDYDLYQFLRNWIEFIRFGWKYYC